MNDDTNKPVKASEVYDQSRQHDTFVFRCTWGGLMFSLGTESAIKVLTAMIDFAMSGKVPQGFDKAESICFAVIHDEMEKNFKKYDQICKKRREAGREGGLRKTKKTEDKVESKQMLANACFAKQVQHDNEYDTYTNGSTTPLPPMGEWEVVDIYVYLEREILKTVEYSDFKQDFNLHGFVECMRNDFKMTVNETMEMARKWNYGRLGTTIWRECSRVLYDKSIRSPKAVLMAIEPRNEDLCLIR